MKRSYPINAQFKPSVSVYHQRFSLSGLLMIAFCGMLLAIGCKKNDNQNVDTSGNTSDDTTTAVYQKYYKLGCGYDVTKRYLNVSSVRAQVIDMNKLSASASDRIIVDNLEDEVSESNAGENYSDYSRGLRAKGKVGIFDSIFKASFEYMDSTSIQSDDVIATYQNYIRKKQLKINASKNRLKENLTAAFMEDVKKESAQYLVKHYGTCVLLDITMGGRLEVVYRSQTSNSDRRASAMAGLQWSLFKIFKIDVGGSTSSTLITKNTNQRLFYHTVGGNSSIGLFNDIHLSDSTPAQLQIGQWHNSISLDNAQLIDIGEDGAVLLSDLIDDPQKSAEVEEYIRQYLLANQIVIGDPPNPVYTYYDPNNNKHACSTSNVPSIKGSFINAGTSFKGYIQPKDGTVQIYEQYDANRNVWIYTQSSTAEPGFSVTGPAFNAFPTQVPGSQPVFEFYYERVHNKKMYYDFYYKTDMSIPDQDTHFSRIAFYAYP